MSEQDGERCSICLEAMATSGEHQITSLECGHMFGFRCIKQWLLDKHSGSLCPTCRRLCDPEKLRKLQWDGSVPIDNQHLEELRTRKEELLAANKTLVRQVGERERDLSICNGELARSRRRYPGLGKRTVVMRRPMTRAGMLLEKKVKNARKLCVTSRCIIVGCEGQNKDEYGVEFWEIENMSHSKFVRIHGAGINDISVSPFDQQTIATVGMDKKVVVTSLRTGQATLECSFANGVMVCEWVEHSTIAVGGAGGKLYLVNGRGEVAFETVLGKGPPILALCRLSGSHLLVCTPVLTKVFNFATLRFEDGEYPGATAVKSSDQGDIIMMCREGSKVFAEIGRFNTSQTLEITRLIPIKKHDTRATPGILRVARQLFYALPDEQLCDFSLFSLELGEQNIWAQYQRMFACPSHPTPILDLCLVQLVDFIVVSLSSQVLKVFALPIT